MRKRVVTIIFLSLCVVHSSAQECASFGGVFERNVSLTERGVLLSRPLTGVESASLSGENSAYFGVELNEERTEFNFFTSDQFSEYAKRENSFFFSIELLFQCGSGGTSQAFVQITLVKENVFAPEFSQQSFEIKIPTPLPRDFEVTALLSERITAIDYDLHSSEIAFAITGSELFKVNSTESMQGTKRSYIVRIFTTQQITRLDGGEVTLMLTGTDSLDEPKSTTVPIVISTDPDASFVEAPAFTQPLYKGLLFANGSFELEPIALVASTYDETMTFATLNDAYGLISLSNDGATVNVAISEENLTAQVLSEKCITFVVQAKRGESEGHAVVVLDVLTDEEEPRIFFSKSLYEGEFHERTRNLTLEDVTLVGSMEGIEFSYPSADADLFDFEEITNAIKITPKEDSLERIVSKAIIMLTIEAHKEGSKVASTTVVIKTIAAAVPQFDKRLYIGSVINGFVSHETISITTEEETLSDDIEVVCENEFFECTLSERKTVDLTLKSEIPGNVSLVPLKMEAMEKDGLRRSEALVIVEIEHDESLEGSLLFESALYEGTLRIDLSVDLAVISINSNEAVEISLSGTHEKFFNVTQNERTLEIKLREEFVLEQFVNDPYLHVAVTISQENLKSATTNIILAIERDNDAEHEGILVLNSQLYQGRLASDMNLTLPTITVNTNEIVNVEFSGTHGDFFTSTQLENVLEVKLKEEFTFEQASSAIYLQATVTVSRENMRSATSNIVIGVEREGFEESIVFNAALYEGKLARNLTVDHPQISLSVGENFEIELSGRHGEFFEHESSGNVVKLKLKDGVALEQFASEMYLQVTMTATHESMRKGVSNVIIEIMREGEERPGSLTFTSPLYEGTLTSEMQLSISTQIALYTIEGVTFELLGAHGSYFDHSYEQGQFMLTFKDGASFEDFSQEIYLQITIFASHESLDSATTNVIIGIVRDAVAPEEEEKLAFNSALYEGTLASNLLLKLPEITITPHENVKINLAGRHGNFFDVSQNDNSVIIESKENVTLDTFADDLYIHITLEATHDSYESTSANIIIGIVKEEAVEDSSAFEKSLYAGSINNQKIFSVEPIFIRSDNIYTTVSVVGNDAEYFSASINQNFVTLILAKEIPADLMFERNVLTAQINSAHEDSSINTNLIVTLPRVTVDNILRFESTHYIGAYDRSSGSFLEIEEIVLEGTNYDSSVEFSLIGTDRSLFDFYRNNNVIQLKLVQSITEEDTRDRVFLTVKVSASRAEYVTAETVVFIHLNVIVSDVQPIQFENPVYVGTLSYDRVLSIDTVKLFADDGTLTSVTHSGEHKEKFTISSVPAGENSTEVEIGFIQQPVDVSEKFYYFYIKAIKIGAPKTYATIVIEIVDKIQLQFNEMKYFGSLDGEQQLTIDLIQLNALLSSEGVTFAVSDGQSRYFDVSSDEDGLRISKTTTIPGVTLGNFRYLWFYLQASGDGFHGAKALVIIETMQPLSEIPIEECYDTLDPTQPFFETGSYFITIANGHSGYVASVRAITTDTTVEFSYSLLFENPFLRERLTILNGDLMLVEAIPTGIYRLRAIAENTANGKQAAANVTLRVTEARVCVGGEPVTTVEKALAIVRIEENTLAPQIMYARVGDCEYEILEVNPSEFNDHIEIDTTTHFIRNTKEFDRESPLFNDSLVAQVLIKLRLNCGAVTVSTSASLSLRSLASNIYTDEILYSPTVTYLSLIILDQNDNYPIFTNPPSPNFNIGFPDQQLIEMTMPERLFKVEAYDLDEGSNAAIRYATTMPATFKIDAFTGEIFAIRAMSDEPFGLILTATDGEGQGLTTAISLRVVKVTLGTVVELTLDASSYHAQLIEQLSQAMNVDMRILSSTQVPFNTASQLAFRKDLSPLEPKTKIYAYAFQPASFILLTAEELLERLSNANLGVSINYGAVDKCSSGESNKSCDLRGWIFAVSFMGTFLLLIVLAIPLIYFVWLRPKLTDDQKSESSKQELAENFYAEPGTSSPVASEVNVNIESIERQSDAEVLGITVEGVTEDSSTSDAERFSNKLLTYLEDESPSNEKKNVSFKEMVERIEVIEDRDDKN